MGTLRDRALEAFAREGRKMVLRKELEAQKKAEGMKRLFVKVLGEEPESIQVNPDGVHEVYAISEGMVFEPYDHVTLVMQGECPWCGETTWSLFIRSPAELGLLLAEGFQTGPEHELECNAVTQALSGAPRGTVELGGLRLAPEKSDGLDVIASGQRVIIEGVIRYAGPED